MATIQNVKGENKTLKQYLAEHPRAVKFAPGARYFVQGDFMTVFFKDDPCYAERLDELLTIYTATKTGELVGCKIKGVSELIKHVRTLIGIEKGDELKINLLLLSAIGNSPAREAYYSLGKKTVGMSIARNALPAIPA